MLSFLKETQGVLYYLNSFAKRFTESVAGYFLTEYMPAKM